MCVILLLFHSTGGHCRLRLRGRTERGSGRVGRLGFEFFIGVSRRFGAPLSVVLKLIRLFQGNGIDRRREPHCFSLVGGGTSGLLALVGRLLAFERVRLSRLGTGGVSLGAFLKKMVNERS